MKIAILWFERDSYPDVLQLMRDRAALPQTWDEWHVQVKQDVELASEKGKVIAKIEFDAGEFLAFCIRHGLSTDGEGRRKYVDLKVANPDGIPVR